MRTWTFVAFGFAAAAASAACGQQAGTLQAAANSLKAADMKTIEYSGTGKWYQFGQAPSPTLPWPPVDVSAYTAPINYDTPAARIQMTRKPVVEPDRVRPAPGEQKVAQYVSGAAGRNLDCQPGARRHARRNDVRGLPRLRRRAVPGAHRPHAGRISGARPDDVVSAVQRSG